MELIKLCGNTYYIKNNTNIGVYKINNNEIILIDSANDKEAGKKILKLINQENYRIKAIINTHSHADHIGGNNIIQKMTNCDVYSNKTEVSFINHTILEPEVLYGAYPIKDLKNKFLYADKSLAKQIPSEFENLEIIDLKGHSNDMIGIKTNDEVVFLGDALISENTIKKYHVFFLTNVKDYLQTMNKLKSLKAKTYVLSHGDVTNNISNLIKLNEDKINEIIEKLCQILKEPKTFEEILSEVFNTYNLKMTINQYYLVGNTIKAYLSYLYYDDKITYTFKNNKMYYEVKGENENV